MLPTFHPLFIQSIRNREERVSSFLDFLRHRDPNAFSEFIRALVISEQEPIARIVDRDLAERIIASRDHNGVEVALCPDPANYTDDNDGKKLAAIQPIGQYFLHHSYRCMQQQMHVRPLMNSSSRSSRSAQIRS